ncbi:tubulin gamma chain-like isoform X1 [Electrophorus electricus]|uniref:tubulin gamma chain-like isoform X1 n=1 Tax=Electrophorus electricus TaxID=8005 RepID=UPI0015CFB295|nr:tubulin gamma chain-like isoform X1 [Electrophorus electricus]XP_035386331.1 tubulin gamma chain-like isoform X1 [Electrophorus electricus]
MLRICEKQGKGGCGSNWAYGYHGGQSRGESGLLARTMEAVRKEATRQDYYGGTVLLHSLSGGTGSGLGSKMCEEICEEFPVHHILTVSVVPHQSGESPLQYYNTLLSLASMHRCADGILLFHNDHALSHAGLPRRSGTVILQQISLSAMNGHVASCMAGLMLPVQSLTKHSDPRQPGQHLLSLQMSYRNCDKVIGVSSGIFSQLTTGMIHKMRLVSHAPAYSPFVPITAISWLLDHVINRAKAMITA